MPACRVNLKGVIFGGVVALLAGRHSSLVRRVCDGGEVMRFRLIPKFNTSTELNATQCLPRVALLTTFLCLASASPCHGGR